MKNYLLPLFLFTIFMSCSSPKNSEEFITKTTGRYLFNANEVIEIYFKEQILHAKWRGNSNIELLKVNDSSFYMKELNEKMMFVSKPKMHIELFEKTEHKGLKFHFRKMKTGEKIPKEYLDAKDYDKALEVFLEIQKQDSLSPVIRERILHDLGYNYIQKNEFEKAVEIFKINTVLYPKVADTFDSLGEAYLLLKDTTNAIKNYKKAISINPENESSLRVLKKINLKK